MTTSEIANRLAEFCRKADFKTAHQELYADTAVSIEPHATVVSEKTTAGLAAILEKNLQFAEMIEQIHEVRISEPIVADHSFAFSLVMDITMKQQKRAVWEEICVYTVKDDRIISEQFFI
jgi:hypothetical protein